MNKPSKPSPNSAGATPNGRRPGPPRRSAKSETELMFADDASTAMKMTDKPNPGAAAADPARPSDGQAAGRPRRPGPPPTGRMQRRGAPGPRSSGRTAGSRSRRPSTKRPRSGPGRPPSGRIPPKPGAQAPRPPRPSPPKPQPAPAPPQQQQRRRKGIVVKHGEYFGTPEEEEELAPLGEVALPRSLIEEEEEKDFRKRFGRSAEEEVVDIYSRERHAAVVVKDDENGDGEQRQVGSAGFIVVVSIILAIAFSGAIVFMFRNELREPLGKIGITLPR